MADWYIPDPETARLVEGGASFDPNISYYGAAARRVAADQGNGPGVQRAGPGTSTSSDNVSGQPSGSVPGIGGRYAGPGAVRIPGAEVANIMRVVAELRAAGDLHLAAEIEGAIVQLGEGAFAFPAAGSGAQGGGIDLNPFDNGSPDFGIDGLSPTSQDGGGGRRGAMVTDPYLGQHWIAADGDDQHHDSHSSSEHTDRDAGTDAGHDAGHDAGEDAVTPLPAVDVPDPEAAERALQEMEEQERQELYEGMSDEDVRQAETERGARAAAQEGRSAAAQEGRSVGAARADAGTRHEEPADPDSGGVPAEFILGLLRAAPALWFSYQATSRGPQSGHGGDPSRDADPTPRGRGAPFGSVRRGWADEPDRPFRNAAAAAQSWAQLRTASASGFGPGGRPISPQVVARLAGALAPVLGSTALAPLLRSTWKLR